MKLWIRLYWLTGKIIHKTHVCKKFLNLVHEPAFLTLNRKTKSPFRRNFLVQSRTFCVNSGLLSQVQSSSKLSLGHSFSSPDPNPKFSRMEQKWERRKPLMQAGGHRFMTGHTLVYWWWDSVSTLVCFVLWMMVPSGCSAWLRWGTISVSTQHSQHCWFSSDFSSVKPASNTLHACFGRPRFSWPCDFQGLWSKTFCQLIYTHLFGKQALLNLLCSTCVL